MESSGEVLYNLRSRKIFSPKTIKEVSRENRKEQILKKAREENLTMAERFGRNARQNCLPNTEFEKRQKAEDIKCAKKALQHYNSREGTSFELVNVQKVRFSTDLPLSNVHMNFLARSNSGVLEELFFASVYIPDRAGGVDTSEIRVSGCCRLKKVSDGDLHGVPCAICGDTVIHPGPRAGYEAESGDKFEGELFQELSKYATPEQPGHIMLISLGK